ncbi:MAG: GIY-YIG nuclease family protein [Patescibacteria group bacterium]
MNDKLKEKIENLPNSPGVYIYKNKDGEIIYIGKAGKLPKRVKSYFLRSADPKAKRMIEKVVDLEYKTTETVIEALILEAKLIKKHEPYFNIKQKDDKSFLYVLITDEKYPRVILKRGREKKEGRSVFGPFVSSSAIRQALRIIRKIFPYNTHTEKQLKRMKRPCFYYQIGLCPGACADDLDREEYLEDIKNIELFFQGKKKKVLKLLEKRMKNASENQEYEKAQKLKKQINSINHIYDTALITPPELEEEKMRIEGYDISNIGGKLATGSMVVFERGKPKKKDYKKFKIKTVTETNDVGMMKEVLERRFNHSWKLPDIILVDGGKGQVNVAKEVLDEKGINIPVVGLAKGEKRDKNELVGDRPDVKKKTLIKVRDEAHRFAVKYHKKLREKDFLS